MHPISILLSSPHGQGRRDDYPKLLPKLHQTPDLWRGKSKYYYCFCHLLSIPMSSLSTNFSLPFLSDVEVMSRILGRIFYFQIHRPIEKSYKHVYNF